MSDVEIAVGIGPGDGDMDRSAHQAPPPAKSSRIVERVNLAGSFIPCRSTACFQSQKAGIASSDDFVVFARQLAQVFKLAGVVAFVPGHEQQKIEHGRLALFVPDGFQLLA